MKPEFLYIFVISLSGFCLCLTYFFDYIMGVMACPLCIYQRFPYLILIFISIIAIAGREYKSYNKYLLITISIGIILAGYHCGVERGIFELSSLCKPLVSAAGNISVGDFKKLLYSQEIGLCNKPALMVYGFSMAEWNLLLNIILFILCARYRNFTSK